MKGAVYDVGGEGTTASQVRALHARRAHVICYVSAGSPFVKQRKPVFVIEYAALSFCPQARRLGFSAVRKHLNLDAWRSPCFSG